MKRWIVECKWAIENEIEVDEFLYKMCNRSSDDYAYTPRPSKWITKFPPADFFSKVFFKVIRFFWKNGACYIYYAIELVKWRSAWQKDLTFKNVELDKVAIGFTDRAYELIPMAIKNTPMFWITFPWNNPKAIPANSNNISILSLLSKKDFFLALLLSRQLHIKMLRSKKTTAHIMQDYAAFRWFLVRIALSRLRAERFYSAEHFDRWAVMADRLKNLTLIQHGALGGGSCGIGVHFNLKYKLRNVEHLYVFNKTSEKIFIDHIIKNNPLSISNFDLSIKLRDVHSKDLKVLFVGHLMCEDFQVELYRKIIQKMKARIFYKPHPLFPPNDKIRDLGWQIVEDRAFFPRVDIVISYPSTLVDEYAIFGIPATLHPINATMEDIEETILNLENVIKNVINI